MPLDYLFRRLGIFWLVAWAGATIHMPRLAPVFLAQLSIRYPYNTTRWTNRSNRDDPYGLLYSWPWELRKTLIYLEPRT